MQVSLSLSFSLSLSVYISTCTYMYRASVDEQAESRDSERRALIDFVQKEASRSQTGTEELIRAEVQDSIEEVFENQLKLQLPNLIQAKLDPMEVYIEMLVRCYRLYI